MTGLVGCVASCMRVAKIANCLRNVLPVARMKRQFLRGVPVVHGHVAHVCNHGYEAKIIQLILNELSDAHGVGMANLNRHIVPI
jgi:hypothetical protein